MTGGRRLAAVAAACVLFAAASAPADRRPTHAEDFGAEAAFLWFETLYRIVQIEGTAPPAAARNYGIASVAFYEAVVPGSRHHRSLVGQLNGLTSLPRAGKADHHWPSAANAAMGDVVRGLYPDMSEESRDLLNHLEADLAGRYEKDQPADALRRSVALGQDVANAVLAWAAQDGYQRLSSCGYTTPAGPGRWVPTAPAFAPPLQPCWGQIRTMVLTSGSECAPGAPPAYSTEPTSEFYAHAFVVHRTRLSLTEAQKEVAHYWADGPGTTGTPPGHSIAIMSGFVQEDGMSLMEAAEGYARVGLAVHDAFIACWSTKYAHNLMRPVTYIQQFIDRSWKPLLGTPNFPEYASGHSTQSGATAVVLTDLFGPRAFTDTTRSRHRLEPSIADRSFGTIEEAAEEAAVSRLYGGIHYPFGNQDGLAQGRCIGRAVVERVAFRKNAAKSKTQVASVR